MFEHVDSLPRLGRSAVAARMLASMLVSMAALLWHGPFSLPIVTGACLGLGIALRAWTLSWRRLVLLLMWQFALILALYALRFGLGGLDDGLRVAWRLALVFLPGMLVMRSTPHGDVARLLTSVLPPKIGFVISTCVLFFPTLWTETLKTYECQVLKGARILPRELLNPLNWRILAEAVFLPAVINSLVLARDIAVAAQCRWYGLHATRTIWPGPDRKE